jgi:transcriptional regulator with XRE-family HTH domain
MATRPKLTRLELARLAARLQQQELAKLTGIAAARLSTFERAHHSPTESQQSAICAALRYPRSALFPAGGDQLAEDTIRCWLTSLNDKGPAGRPSLVTKSPGQGRDEQR